MKKTPDGIDMYDVDSNGGEVFGSHTIFGYEDSESLWNQTNASGGYNYKLNENSAIQMLNQVGSAAKQVFIPETEPGGAGLPGSEVVKAAKDLIISGLTGLGKGTAAELEARGLPAPESPTPTPTSPMAERGIYPSQPWEGEDPLFKGSTSGLTPSVPVLPQITSPEQDIPVSGYGIPFVPPTPTPVPPTAVPTPVVPPVVPTPTPEAPWYEALTTFEQVEAAFNNEEITYGQAKEWFELYNQNNPNNPILPRIQQQLLKRLSVNTAVSSTAPGYVPSVPSKEATKEGFVPLTNRQNDQIFTASSYSSVPWNPIYKDFLNKNFGAGNPILQYWNQQGLSNDPLQRSVYTQFLLQATEDDPWGGQLEGGPVIGGQPGGRIYAGLDADPNSNAFNNFLEGYKPLEGKELQEKIQGVLQTLRVPEDDWIDYESEKEETYTPEQLRDYRWRNRFGVSTQSSSNQEALAALPIMQQTPALLRNETATILKSLHDRWQANPGRNPNEGWLEFVVRNNYFGMIQEQERERNYQGETTVS